MANIVDVPNNIDRNIDEKELNTTIDSIDISKNKDALEKLLKTVKIIIKLMEPKE